LFFRISRLTSVTLWQPCTAAAASADTFV
jgi:hypothetical protein